MSDVLDRIDADIQAWEARPESWLPGDPLYDHPFDRGGDAQTVRPMFQLVEDSGPLPRCAPCRVSWSGDDPCWMCGEERPPVYALGGTIAALTVGGARAVLDLRCFVRAASEMEQAMHRLRQVVERDCSTAIERLYARLMPISELTPPRLNGPSPLPVDGHAYRRRTRRRTRR